MERGNVAGVIGFGHDWATLLARGPRAPLTALRFASASRRKLATPLATQSCGFEHSSRLPTAAAIAQPERSPNGALITLRESPSHSLGEINRNPKEEKLEEKGKCGGPSQRASSQGRRSNPSICGTTPAVGMESKRAVAQRRFDMIPESPSMARGLMTHTQAIGRTRKRKESNLWSVWPEKLLRI